MENYDPEFQSKANRGDLLTGAFNFGTGSSREQAATALKHRGTALVLAGSFSETYKRNALNNGFLVLEAPDLARDLKKRFGEAELTVRTGLTAELDFRRALLSVEGKDYAVADGDVVEFRFNVVVRRDRRYRARRQRGGRSG